MFSESHNDRHRRPRGMATDRLRYCNKATGIGDDSAEIGDDAAEIVDIAAKVIPWRLE